MMRRFFLALLVVPIAACAVVTQRPDTSLYDAYQRYREAVVDGSVVMRRTELFASSVLNEIDVTSEQDTKVLKLSGSIVKEHSHYEKIEPNRGCLTVNGYADDDGKPVSLFIEYQARLITFQHLYFPDTKRFKGFSEKALCPDEAQEHIMREFEKGK